MTKKNIKSRLNCSDEELKRMQKHSPETRLEWLNSAVEFAKAIKTIKN
jgi:hypothetical protein